LTLAQFLTKKVKKHYVVRKTTPGRCVYEENISF